jgi:hypothetical protein
MCFVTNGTRYAIDRSIGTKQAAYMRTLFIFEIEQYIFTPSTFSRNLHVTKFGSGDVQMPTSAQISVHTRDPNGDSSESIPVSAHLNIRQSLECGQRACHIHIP